MKSWEELKEYIRKRYFNNACSVYFSNDGEQEFLKFYDLTFYNNGEVLSKEYGLIAIDCFAPKIYKIIKLLNQ